MAQDLESVTEEGTAKAKAPPYMEPSILNALPHYLPLGIFPLLFASATYGGWWLLPTFLFMSITVVGDKAFGQDGRNMNPAKTPERRLLWHNFPVWIWAFLWPLTLTYSMWQILVANQLAVWEDVILVLLLTTEAQAVFVVGHELVHRRRMWERRLAEFLLSSASYPQYATEHVYIHHAFVGTPSDVGSARKGESFWRYFPKEVVSNLTNSWQTASERLARRRLPVWHYTNPFWRYAAAIAFWYGLVFWMGGIWSVLVFALLGLCCVFSMKISNYFQHYGLRRVRMANGRWEKIMPRHSWSADWKFSNWMFFNMQRHADHHAMASRHYPLLQVRNADESPELPGTYGDLMNLVLRPKRWFEKMDPLVDQWRKHFYPEIDDWSAYDSPISSTRPDVFDAVIEIFDVAPRLASWVERNPELLDNLKSREFTDLDLPKGFGPDLESESIARRGLTRLYWTLEMGVAEMKELLSEIPTADAKETAEIVRNWSNDRAFQIGMHVIRGNLAPSEAGIALTNLAEASVSTVLGAVVADNVERIGPMETGGLGAIFLGDLASKEAHSGVEAEMIFVHDGLQSDENDRLYRLLSACIADLARDSLLFSPISLESNPWISLRLDGLDEHFANVEQGEVPALSRARCVFECGDVDIGRRFDEARRELLNRYRTNEKFLEALGKPLLSDSGSGVYSFRDTRGGHDDVERTSRFLQLKRSIGIEDSAPTATAVFENAGAESLAQAAGLYREILGVQTLVVENGCDLTATSPKVKSLIATSCGYESFESLDSAVNDIASQAASESERLVSSDEAIE